MSWTDSKRLRLPFMSSNRPSQDLVRRNIEENKVLAASLRKLPHMHRRWFVLYSASDKFPAKLEYYLNEKQWREGYTPKTIILKDCFNICKKQDSRDSKNKHVIAIYTLNKCHSILFEEEQELRNWLVQLLSHQKGSSGDGRIPKPNFENMWQVNVKPFKSEDPLNTFVMSGAHRLCVTESDLKFFPIGTSVPISFPFISLRAFQCNDRIFQIETGRSAPSGPGTIYVHSDDKEISAKIMSAVHEAMQNSRENNTLNLPKNIQNIIKPKDNLSSSPASSDLKPASVPASSPLYRPRSESCSEMDKPKSHKPPSKPSLHNFSMNSMPNGPRNRTISEGNHFESFRALRGRGKPSISSGSPMSPSPGSCISSESAGSSNSLDESDFAHDPRRHTSVTESQAPMTIYEESSAESGIDPNANRELYDSSLMNKTISHTRTHSDNQVHYTPVEVIGSDDVHPPQDAPTSRQTPVGSHYATFVSKQTPTTDSNEYMAMTPNSGNNSTCSSLKRHSSLDQPSYGSAEQRKLMMLGLAEEAVGPNVAPGGGSSAATITSPSSQSSYNPLEDIDEQPSSSNSAYHAMSPLSSVSKSIPISGRSNTVEDDEYMSMSPSTASASASASTSTSNVKVRQQMAINLHEGGNNSKQSYELMSPVSIDQEKLRRISEEDSGGGLVGGSKGGADRDYVPLGRPHNGNGSHGGARPKQPRSTGSKRSSLCSDMGGDMDEHFQQLQLNHPAFEHEEDKTTTHNDTADYVALDYSHNNYSSGGIPIPHSSRMSPASSGSLISGTPNSVSDTRFPPDFHFETKAVSYLRQDDDDEGASPPTSTLPIRAYSVSTASRASASNSSLSARSRTSSITGTKFVDIPQSSRSKLSPATHRTQESSANSPNFISRLDNWFRSRTGSVPSRPPLTGRRRHRTQSEGEKDSASGQDVSSTPGNTNTSSNSKR